MQLLRLLIRFRFHTDKIFIKDHNFLLVMFLNEIKKNICILFVLKKNGMNKLFICIKFVERLTRSKHK